MLLCKQAQMSLALPVPLLVLRQQPVSQVELQASPRILVGPQMARSERFSNVVATVATCFGLLPSGTNFGSYGNKMFIASTIDGSIFRSIDGLAWTSLGNAGTGKHSRVVFGNGVFAVSGDPGKTVTSPDGTKWQPSPVADPVAFCGGEFNTNRTCYGDPYNAGFWIEGTWLRDLGGIQLSSDGKTWKTVFQPATNGY